MTAEVNCAFYQNGECLIFRPAWDVAVSTRKGESLVIEPNFNPVWGIPSGACIESNPTDGWKLHYICLVPQRTSCNYLVLSNQPTE